MRNPDGWSAARRILCVRPDNFGDVLMTTPAFRALKSLNNAQLTLLASDAGAAVAPFIPELDRVIRFNAPWVGGAAEPDPAAVFTCIEQIRDGAFDAAVVFTVFSQNPLPTALLGYLAGVPLRLAYCRENPYHLLTDWLPDSEPFDGISHEVERQLRLVESVGATSADDRLSLRIPEASSQQALARLNAAGVDSEKPWLILHPGVSETKRQYGATRFIQVGRMLAAVGFQLVLTGTAAEQALCDQVGQGIGKGAFSLAGRFELGEFIGLVSAAPLLIANNTGPVHIAAAVGTPVVVLYAHTNPQHTPWRAAHRTLYFDVPPELRSKNSLLTYSYRQTVPQPVADATPEDVVTAALELLRRPQPASRPSAVGW